MRTSFTFQRFFTLIACLLVSVACTSSKAQPDLAVDVDDQENLSIAISSAVARGVMEDLVGSHLDCEGDVDPDVEKLLSTLDRGGSRSNATYRDGETTVAARRRGGKLHFDISGGGSGKIEATMPWAVAECLLGRGTTIDKAIRSSIKVKVTNEGGGSFSFRLN
jgi:hypothetical protein